jgi:hypothetical protein
MVRTLILALAMTGGLLLMGDGAEPAPAASASPAPSAAPPQDHIAGLRTRLTGAQFEGSWRVTSTVEGAREPLSEAHEETYLISDATHVSGEQWIISARIRYAEKDVTIPVPVRIVWAGDTPVITLDGANLPLLGTYSARVMVYKDFYSGVWLAAGHGGVMSGRIVRPAAEPSASPVATPAATTP